MIRIDYHTHNLRCGHAQGQIEDYIKAAIDLGMTDIGISDHSPIYWLDGNDPMPGIAMAKDELDGYVSEVLALKSRYAGQINVRLGLECDYVETMETFYRDLLARYPFDYVIGSVHHVFDVSIFHAPRWNNRPDPMPIFAEYYRLVEKSARSGLFDVIGHATAITAYAPKPIPSAIEPLQDAVLRAIAESGVSMEVNTSGYRKMATDPFPTARMISEAYRMGIPLTYSSDCHQPREVGYARDRIAALFAEIGVAEIATFEGRRRVMVPFVNEVETATQLRLL